MKNIARKPLIRKRKLSVLVKTEIKTNAKFQKLLKRKHAPLWIPSTRSFLKIFIIFVVVLILTRIDLKVNNEFILRIDIFNRINIPFIAKGSSEYQNLISITSGIGSVLIGLAFFVAQSLMDKEDPDKAKILLYKSKFFPLLTGIIFIFLILLTGDLNYFIYAVIIFIGFLTIYSLGRTIEILIRANDLEKAKIKAFTDILNQSFIKIMNDELIRRISINKSLDEVKRLSDKYGGLVSFEPFESSNEDRFIKIKSPLIGTITDIDFYEMEELIKSIVIFMKTNSDILFEKYSDSNDATNVKNTRKTSLLYVVRKPFDKVEENSTIIEINKDITNYQNIMTVIEKRIRSIFEIKSVVDNEESARFELLRLKQSCLKFINNKNVDELKKSLRLYNLLILELYEFMSQYGGGFSKEQAEDERKSFHSEQLKPIYWLSEDVRELFEKAIDSENISIIKNVAYLPITLARLAIEKRDHLIYQKFIYYPLLIYRKGFINFSNNKDISDFMIDRSWRYINELSGFYLEYEYIEKKIAESDFMDFAFYLLKVYQDLLKQSYDNGDLKNFSSFLEKMHQLFNGINQRFYYHENQSESVVIKLEGLRYEAIFGLGSWILNEILHKRGKDSIFEYYHLIIKYLPSKLVELTKVFIDSHSFEKEKEWEWDDWEQENHQEMVVYSSDFLGKLEAFYAVLSLNLLSQLTSEEITSINLPNSRELAFLADGTRDLINIIQKIKARHNDFASIISDIGFEKCDKFVELLTKAKERQEDMERLIKRKTPISKAKVLDFKKNVIKNIRSTLGIRTILSHYGLLIEAMDNKNINTENKFGINTFFDKSAFLSDEIEPHIHYAGIDDGFEFGRSLINGENNVIVSRINEALTQINQNEFENYLSRKGDLSKIIILSTYHGIMNYFETKYYPNQFIPKWHNEFPEDSKSLFASNIGGILKFNNTLIPVYEISDYGNDIGILILDISKLGKLIQKSPLDDKTCKDDMIDHVTIKVMDIGKCSTLKNEILENPPTWLSNIGPREVQEEYLQERVIIQVYERFDFVIDNEIEGVRIILKQE